MRSHSVIVLRLNLASAMSIEIHTLLIWRAEQYHWVMDKPMECHTKKNLAALLSEISSLVDWSRPFGEVHYMVYSN